MKSRYRVGSRVSAGGFQGTVVNIKETYRKNVLVVRVKVKSNRKIYKNQVTDFVGLLEDKDGLRFMNIITQGVVSEDS